MSKKMTTRARDRVIRLVQSSRDIWIGTHIRPDGDALGSLLGLSLALERTGRRVAPLCADPVPENYRFLPGADRISPEPPEWKADLGIVLDCDGLSRLGPLEPVFGQLSHLIDIDHHHTDHSFGEERLVDSTAGATAEIVHHLLQGLQLQPDADVGTCLYTAILTDTGRFCYGNTTARSLRIAAEMVAAGAAPDDVARKVYEERSIQATHLLGVALSRLSADLEGQVVSSVFTQKDFRETGAEPGDTDGIIAHLRAIGGPRVAMLLVEPNHDAVRVSLRSDGSVDVSEVALGFGGGGHMMAAGCTIPGTAEGAREQVLEAVQKALDRPSGHHGG